MGSKRSMLLNGLGEAIADAVPRYSRFVDMFAGSAVVAWHVAQRYNVEVLASDLQQYSVVLASSVIARTRPLKSECVEEWISRAIRWTDASEYHSAAKRLQARIGAEEIAISSSRARALCADMPYLISNAYGGYYFSPLQALSIDALRATLPANRDVRRSALASLVWAASRCAAAPGHTAQPFKPNATAGIYLQEAWERDVYALVRQSYAAIAPQFSRKKGSAKKSDANLLATELGERDLVFLDPPYSGVHYSRFYHVLETLVENRRVIVSGAGRYPPVERRPQSAYSLANASEQALLSLFKNLSAVGCAAIVTFPSGKTSNGLSGTTVGSLAEQFFRIKSRKVSSRFSTLGGNLRNRDARQASEELILTLSPR